MATSSIKKNFIVSGEKQVEIFANAIEDSYQESLRRVSAPDLNITYLKGASEIKNFLARRKNVND